MKLHITMAVIAALALASIGLAAPHVFPKEDTVPSTKCTRCSGSGWDGKFKCARCGGDGDIGR